MEKITVTATKIHTPRDLYRVAQSHVKGKNYLYVEKGGRRARAESMIGLINLNIQTGDPVSVVTMNNQFVDSAITLGNLLGDVPGTYSH